MATAQDALDCCNANMMLLEQVLAQIAGLETRLAALEASTASKDPRVDQMFEFLLPAMNNQIGKSDIQLYLLEELANDSEMQDAAEVAVKRALGRGGLPTRDAFVSTIIDSLGRMLLGWLEFAWQAYSSAFPFTIDRVLGTDADLLENSEDTVQFDLTDRVAPSLTDIEAASAILDGGTDTNLGASGIRGTVGQTIGLYLADIIAEVVVKVIHDLTSVLQDERPVQEGLEPEFEQWQHDFQREVGTVPGFTAAEFAVLTGNLGGDVIPITPPAEGGKPPEQSATPPESSGTPTGP